MSTNVWVGGMWELSEFGCRFGWYFIVFDVTVLAFAEIIHIRETGH